jgi:hypothetical protein
VRYADEAVTNGTIDSLSRAFPQLLFPIGEGISLTESYEAATRRGVWSERNEHAKGLGLRRRDLVRISLTETLAGRIPVLVAGEREDFEDLVRAFSSRNEPVVVPLSMGACLVRGLTNWDRVRSHRTQWEAQNPGGDWAEGFQALVSRKELYEDRFIILSTGPYSGVTAREAGMDDESRWLALSLSIRREHEATHYLSLRATGATRNDIVDELIADFAGLVRTFGRYRADLALMFLGLESYPHYREGARLQNYKGQPPFSEAAFEHAKRDAYDAVLNLARLDEACSESRERRGLARLVLSLMSLPLEELATSDLRSHVSGDEPRITDQTPTPRGSGRT